MIFGLMDKRITIQNLTETRGADGTPIEIWSTYKTVWANVIYRNIRGKERVEQDRETAINMAEFRINAKSAPGVNEKMRISYDRGIWDITSMSKIGRDEVIILYGEFRY